MLDGVVYEYNNEQIIYPDHVFDVYCTENSLQLYIPKFNYDTNMFIQSIIKYIESTSTYAFFVRSIGNYTENI